MALMDFGNFLEKANEAKLVNPEFENMGKIKPDTVTSLNNVVTNIVYHNNAHMSFEWKRMGKLRPLLIYGENYLLSFPLTEKELIDVSSNLHMHYHTYGEIIEDGTELIFFMKSVSDKKYTHLGTVNSAGEIIALYSDGYKQKKNAASLLTKELVKYPRWKNNLNKFFKEDA